MTTNAPIAKRISHIQRKLSAEDKAIFDSIWFDLLEVVIGTKEAAQVAGLVKPNAASAAAGSAHSL